MFEMIKISKMAKSPDKTRPNDARKSSTNNKTSTSSTSTKIVTSKRTLAKKIVLFWKRLTPDFERNLAVCINMKTIVAHT